MLGFFYPVKLTPTQQFFYYIRTGKWQTVFKLLNRDQSLFLQYDDFPATPHWTILDHAAAQARIDILEKLNHLYQLSGEILPGLMTTFIVRERWDLFFYILDAGFCSVNAQDAEGFTLLDQLEHCQKIDMAAVLRQKYDAKRIAELMEENMVMDVQTIDQDSFERDCLKWEDLWSCDKTLVFSQYVKGVKELEPEKDPIEPFKNKTEVGKIQPIGYNRPKESR